MSVSIFDTALGWCGLAGTGATVHALWLGHRSGDGVRRMIHNGHGAALPAKTREEDWHPELRQRLIDYFDGAPDAFDDVPVRLEGLTAFQQRVVRALRQVGVGETVSYGELAKRAGRPGAARAVGQVMARNRVPIVIPCHRVVGAGGRLGGFSAPQGTALKRRLLDLEAAALSLT